MRRQDHSKILNSHEIVTVDITDCKTSKSRVLQVGSYDDNDDVTSSATV
jgi:hypothetical protein